VRARVVKQCYLNIKGCKGIWELPAHSPYITLFEDVFWGVIKDRFVVKNRNRNGHIMRVTLAGYNFDAQQIELIRQITDEFSHNGTESEYLSNLLTQLAEEPFTPETISAAYARISRSDKGIRDLRRDARASVSRARRSNENIIFGLGHSSIAEHAVFNLDITGISRLALESLEAHRLASYTESSQRYISMSGDFEVPDEISEIGMRDEFEKACLELFRIYGILSDKLTEHHSDLSGQEKSGKAQEDARYVLPLACRGQVGMTINARTAEKMILTFNNSHLKEVKSFGKQLHGELHKIVPSLIRYTEPNPAIQAVEKELSAFVAEMGNNSSEQDEDDVILLNSPHELENVALATLLMKVGNQDYNYYLNYVNQLSAQEKIEMIANNHSYISEHDPVRRELELGYFVYRITLSASAYAQLKRHRLTSQFKQDYIPSLGFIPPPSIQDAECTEIFASAMNCSNEIYVKLTEKLEGRQSSIAQYALTNAHKCRVVFQLNSRELTHFARLRMDTHAQWDIRNIATKIVDLAKRECPGLVQFACGKDKFDDLKSNVFNNKENNK